MYTKKIFEYTICALYNSALEYIRMKKVLLSLLVCFTAQIYASLEPTNIVEAALYYRHTSFSTYDLTEFKRISKHINALIKKAEDRYYSIATKDLSHTASIKLICGECFKEACSCKKNTHKYRGLFCITTPEKKEYAVYLPSSEANKLIDIEDSISTLYNKIAPLNHIFNIQCKSAPIARIRMPAPQCRWNGYVVKINTITQKEEFKDAAFYFSYNQTSKPYFIKSTDEVGVLAGILDKSKCSRTMYEIPLLTTVYECSLAQNNGFYKTRKVFFEFNGKDYPFGLLLQFPALYGEYLAQIENQSCSWIRSEINDTITFLSDTFYTNALNKEPGMLTILSEMLTAYHVAINEHFTQYPNSSGWKYEFLYRKLLDNYPGRFIGFTWCAHLCGSEGNDYLSVYDKSLPPKALSFDSNKKIYLNPLTGIHGTQSRGSSFNYIKKYSECTQLPELLTMIEEVKNSLQIVKMSDTNFLEIRKKDTRHKVYHWCFTKIISQGCKTQRWYRNRKYFIFVDGSIKENLSSEDDVKYRCLFSSADTPSIQEMETTAIDTINTIFLNKNGADIYAECTPASLETANLFSYSQTRLLPLPKIQTPEIQKKALKKPTPKNSFALLSGIFISLLHPRNICLWMWDLAYWLKIWSVPPLPDSGHGE